MIPIENVNFTPYYVKFFGQGLVVQQYLDKLITISTTSTHIPGHSKLSCFQTECIHFGNRDKRPCTSEDGVNVPHSVMYLHTVYEEVLIGSGLLGEFGLMNSVFLIS